jgi:hypothetical protein
MAIILFSTLEFSNIKKNQITNPTKEPVQEKTTPISQKTLVIPPLNQIPSQAPWQSTRLKSKRPVHFITGTSVLAPLHNRIPFLRAGIQSLINEFPYPQFTDDEIVNMFTDCGFSLGTTNKIRLKLVQHFISLTKQKLSYLLNEIIDKISSENNNINIDLSEELLPLGSLLNLWIYLVGMLEVWEVLNVDI